jgi:holo-[acyl-carrier protein] synthase
MLIGLGIDLAEVSFWRQALADPATAVVEKTFTTAERAYALSSHGDPAQHLAARFAAKEACIKAMGAARSPHPPLLANLDLRCIEVIRDAHGRPSLSLRGAARVLAEALGVRHHWLSLTHTGDTAGAVVVLEG